jgi:mRNA-degrading endonuclease RelE of RelBE toxin-antitoxin system
MVMAGKHPFELVYDPEISDHLAAIDRKHHSLIRAVIEDQLRFEPQVASRNRKQLERPIDLGARWELRLGPNNRFRVFYRVDAKRDQVRILAIAVKERNRIFIAGKEVEL